MFRTRASRRTPFWQIAGGILVLAALLAVGVFLGLGDQIEKVAPVAALQEIEKQKPEPKAPPAKDVNKSMLAHSTAGIVLFPKPPPESRPNSAVKIVPLRVGPDLPSKVFSPARAGLNLPELIDRVKRATVYLRVTAPDGRIGEGSGFFGVEAGLVLTNAHVLGIVQPGNPPPKHIEAIINSGTSEERAYAGQILGVDPLTDLAVLRIDGLDLPAPLAVQQAKQLRELERVYIFGFPFGQTLGKHITVSESSVSSLRTDAEGNLDKIQVNGGMHPGNSGGPVVDSRGAVVGVAVSGIHGTQISFAVPGEFVHALLNGRLAGHVVGMPYRDGNYVKVPYEMVLLDPLQRIRQAQVEYWCGSPRPRSGKEPAALPSSQPQKLALTCENGRARGELRLIQAEPGKTLWLRAGFVTGAGEQRWAADQAHPLMPPLLRKTVRLQLARVPGRHPVHLLSSARLHQAIEGASKTLVTHLDVPMVEKIQPLAKDSLVQIEYGTAKVVIEANGKPAPKNPRLQDTVEQVPVLVFELYQDPAGNLRPYRLNRTRVPYELRDDVSELHQQILDSLLAVNLTLPNREVKARETWKSVLALPGPPEQRADLAVLEFVCTYEGILSRAGRNEALITLLGEIRPGGSQKKQYRGRAEGQALLDLASGQFVDIAVTMFLDMEPKIIEGRPVHTTGSLDIRLHRDVTPKTPTP